MARVLMLDDNRNFTTNLKNMLEIEGYEVHVAHTVAAAAVYDLEAVNLVISDWNLPDGTGNEILQIFPNMPIIIITGDENAAKHLRNSGVVCMTKPVNLQAVLTQVKSMAPS